MALLLNEQIGNLEMALSHQRLKRKLKESLRFATGYVDQFLHGRKKTIVVLQMGKVGSSSIVRALSDSLPDHRVLHLHLASDASIEKAIKKVRQSQYDHFDEHLVTSMLTAKHLRNRDQRMQIITLTREPIERTLSFVFQDIKRELGLPPYQKDLREECTRLVERRLDYGGSFTDPKKWFDTELLESFGIDLFSSPFPIEVGYTTTVHENVDLLCIRMENLRQAETTEALSQFVGVQCELTQKPINAGGDKENGEIYRELTRSMKLPADLVNRVVSTDFFRHFYSDYTQKVIEKWT